MVFLVSKELHLSLDYILYEMEWHIFIEAYNWCLMYIHQYTRTWIKPGEDTSGMTYKMVYDEANQNWIDYMESEKDRYEWREDKHCFYLPKGK